MIMPIRQPQAMAKLPKLSKISISMKAHLSLNNHLPARKSNNNHHQSQGRPRSKLTRQPAMIISRTQRKMRVTGALITLSRE